MRKLRLLACALLLPVLASCTTLAARRGFEALPLLAPAAFGAEAASSQRLQLSRDADATAFTIDAAVEVDASELRVAGFLLGQRILLLTWDGSQLQQVREPMVPAALDGRAILRDLQLVYWPAGAVRAVLPRGWRLEEEAARRRLYRGNTVMFESDRSDAIPLGNATLWNRIGQYRIDIEASHESR